MDVRAPQSVEVKLQSRRWWDRNPMDYVGHGTAGEELGQDDESDRQFFERIDSAFREDQAYFAQAPGAGFFSDVLDLPSLAGKRVLEIGCGMGKHSETLARAGAEVVALDQTERAARVTRRRGELGGLGIRVVRGDAENLPFEHGAFDFVWSWGVIHHTPRTERAAAEIARVLRPGGRIGVMLYNSQSLYNWLNVVLRYGVLRLELFKHSQQELRNRYTDGKYLGGCPLARYFSAAEARAMFPGFTGLGIRTFGQKGLLTKLVPRPFRRWVWEHSAREWTLGPLAGWGFLMLLTGAKPGS